LVICRRVVAGVERDEITNGSHAPCGSYPGIPTVPSGAPDMRDITTIGRPCPTVRCSGLGASPRVRGSYLLLAAIVTMHPGVGSRGPRR
jgi:hypothetical protein